MPSIRQNVPATTILQLPRSGLRVPSTTAVSAHQRRPTHGRSRIPAGLSVRLYPIGTMVSNDERRLRRERSSQPISSRTDIDCVYRMPRPYDLARGQPDGKSLRRDQSGS